MNEEKITTELKKWFVATRPWSIPASAAPLLVVCAWLYATHSDVRWVLAPIAFLSAVSFHLAGNLISDYFDFIYGVDTLETAGSRTLPDGIFRPRTLLYFGFTILCVASVLGLFLAYESDWKLLFFGIFGAVAVLFYYLIKFRGFGVFLIFVVFGPCIALGVEYTLTTKLSHAVLALSLPIGLLTTAILHANDIRDMPHDRAAGIHTFALWIGLQAAKRVYRLLVLVPYLLIGVYVALGTITPISLVVLATLPFASSNIRFLNDSDKIQSLDRQTAKLQTAFSALLIASMCLASIVKL
ncbi:MAG: prenyltransferase [Thermoguttaceae bacterium]|nr:prenyltransferase [Thermoguttaceae bacterium]